jgi:hypothetical protein
VEHHGNLLRARGFLRLKAALARGDRGELLALLAPGFEAVVPGSFREVSARRPELTAVRREPAGAGRRVGDAAFADWLLALARDFSPAPVVEASLERLKPDRPGVVESAGWSGRCLLRLAGTSRTGGPLEAQAFLEFRIDRPSREVFQRGRWLRSVTVGDTLTARASRSLMRDATAGSGLDTTRLHDNWKAAAPEDRSPATGGVFLCDYDRDGMVDVLVTDDDGHFLYRGRPGGRFEDVTKSMGLRHMPRPVETPFLEVIRPMGLRRMPRSVESLFLMAAFADLDGDGWEDLILAGRVYRNERGTRFVDHTASTRLILPANTVGIAIADYDRDGRVDLYLSCPGQPLSDSWVSGKATGGENQLWRNKGDWVFENVTASARAGAPERSTFTSGWLDANADGWPDIHVIHEYGNGILLVNNGNGTFREVPLGNGPTDFGSMGLACGDIDNDGAIDLYVAGMYSKAGSRVIANMRPDSYPPDVMAKIRQFVLGSQLYRNVGGLKFEPAGDRCRVASVGWAYGPALVDLDNDGFLDIFATAGFVSSDRNKPDG